jgi:hypothetical protein
MRQHSRHRYRTAGRPGRRDTEENSRTFESSWLAAGSGTALAPARAFAEGLVHDMTR